MLVLEKHTYKGRCANEKNKGVNIILLLEITAMFTWLK